jgi:hypothetical protein
MPVKWELVEMAAFLGNQLVKYLDGEWYGLGKRNFLGKM